MRRQYRAILENLCCLAILALLPLYILFPAVGRGHVPMALTSPLFEAPWQDVRPEGLQQDATPFANIQAHRIYPWLAFLSNSAGQGQSLLWNPSEAGGYPFLAAWETRVFSPFSIPFYVMPLNQALVWSFFAKMFVAGLCAYYVSRRFGFPAPFALFVAITWQLSGAATAWAPLPFSDVLVWLPLLIMFTEQVALGQRNAWPVGAFALGLMALGGDPPAFAACLAFSIVLLIVRVAMLREFGRFKAALLPFTGALLLAAAFAAAQILPYIEFLRESAPAGSEMPLHLHVADLVALFVPGITGAGRQSDVPMTQLVFCGALPVLSIVLWLALRGFVEAPLRKRVEALLITAAAFTVAAFAVGGDALSGWGARCLLFSHGLALAWMTAAALEEWQELNADQIKPALARLVWLVPVCWGVALIAAAAWLSNLEAPSRPWAGPFAIFVLAALALLALLAATIFRPSIRLAGYGAAIIAACSMLWTGAAAMQFTPPDLVFPETTFVKDVRATKQRLCGSASVAGWPLSVNGIDQLSGPTGIRLARFTQFMDVTSRDPMLLRRAGSKLLLLTKEDIQGPFASVRSMLAIRKVFTSGAVLFEDQDAKPRAWMAYVWRPVESFDPNLISWNRLPVVETTALPEKNTAPDAAPAVELQSGNDWVTVKVNTPQRGVLVLADAWYPGWEASVDGVSEETFPVDGLFRGVRVKEGEHTISFRYQNRAFKAGLIISGLASLVLLYGLGRLLSQRLRSVPAL